MKFSKAELYFLERGRYGEIARKVDLCLRVADRPCRGGECDQDKPCPRHQQTLSIFDRYTRRYGG